MYQLSSLSNDLFRSAEALFCKTILNFTSEQALCIYSFFQSYVVRQERTNPEFSTRIHQIQPTLDMANVLWIMWKINNLYKLTREGPSTFCLKQFSDTGVAIFTATGVALFTLSAFWVGKTVQEILDKYVKPPQTPCELLEGVEIPEAKQKTIALNWKRPKSQQNSQIIYITGIIFNIALSFLSKHYPVYLINASNQAYCLWNISKLRWLKFSKTFY